MSNLTKQKPATNWMLTETELAELEQHVPNPSIEVVQTIELPEQAKPEQPKFPLGRVILTAADDTFPHLGDFLRALALHAGGDWGHVGEEQFERNQQSLRDGGPLRSSHADRNGRILSITTGADRSLTEIRILEDF